MINEWVTGHGVRKRIGCRDTIIYYDFSHSKVPAQIRIQDNGSLNNKKRECYRGNYKVQFYSGS